jgi:2-polyprenyl-3-methyl-5-hydroxy-6-metoxy-1,4-benzoquinol methylase
MKLNYKNTIERQNVDINKLRPGKSYDYLIENRTGDFESLISNEERLKEMLKKIDCPLCGADAYEHKFKKDNLNVVRCKQCGCIYVNPVFDTEKYFKAYKSEDYQKIGKKLSESSHDYRKERFGKERVEYIEKFHNDTLPKTMLDIGCSTGFVLEVAKERGWDATGIELNPSSVEFARKRNLTVMDKPLEEINFSKKFSAITLYDVLEHLPDPKKILHKVRELLEKDGNIFIYVPNYESASKELLGVQNSHFIWPTHHLTYFTPETLKEFLENNGFEVIFWETQGLDVYDWLWYLEEKTDSDTTLLRKHAETFQSYINGSGHGKNLRMYAKKI